jgi:hypothetical protein
VFLLLLQVTVAFIADREGNRGGSRFRSPCCLEFLAAARGEDALPQFKCPETFLSTVPAVPKVFLCNSWIF